MNERWKNLWERLRPFRRKHEAEKVGDEPLDAQQELEGIGDFVLPDLDALEPDPETADEKEEADDELPAAYEVYKQRGFLIAISDGKNTRSDLGRLLAAMRLQQKDDEAHLNHSIDQYKSPFFEKFLFFGALIGQLKDKLNSNTDSLSGYLAEREALAAQRQAGIDAKWQIGEQVAAAKENLLSKWIEEAKQRIIEILAANKEVQEEKQRIALDLYNKNKVQNDAIVKELSHTRNILKERLKEWRKRREVIVGEGLSRRGIKFLLKTGISLGVAAGLFFAVFTLHAAFGSEDMASFIFNALLEKIDSIHTGSLAKILDLLLVLGIIAVACLLCRSVIIHMRKKQAHSSPEDKEEHYLQLKIRNDTIRYSGMFRTTNWPLFWFKILPLLLLAGTVLIFIAHKPAGDLNDSMGGLIIGGLVASGVAAFCYLYIVKIIEPRLLRKAKGTGAAQGSHLRWIRHWELVAAFLLFITVTLLVAWYAGYRGISSNDLGHPAYRLIALLWFLSVTLLCGFTVAYGIRYQCIDDMELELESRKLAYDDLIDHFSGVVRTDSNSRLNQLMDALTQKLGQHLVRRNDVIFNDRGVVQVQTKREKQTGGKKPNAFLRGMADLLNKTWLGLLWLLELIFFPSERDDKPDDYDRLEQTMIRTMVEWEKEYFASHYHKIGMHNQELERLEEAIAAIDKKIQQRDDVNSEPIVTLIKSLDKATEQQRICNRYLVYAESVRMKILRRIQAKYLLAIDLINKGYQTGTWYKGQDDKM